jgi:hypothetical protein
MAGGQRRPETFGCFAASAAKTISENGACVTSQNKPYPERYSQLMPDVALSTRRIGNLIPDTSMDYSQENGVLRVECSLR